MNQIGLDSGDDGGAERGGIFQYTAESPASIASPDCSPSGATCGGFLYTVPSPSPSPTAPSCSLRLSADWSGTTSADSAMNPKRRGGRRLDWGSSPKKQEEQKMVEAAAGASVVSLPAVAAACAAAPGACSSPLDRRVGGLVRGGEMQQHSKKDGRGTHLQQQQMAVQRDRDRAQLRPPDHGQTELLVPEIKPPPSTAVTAAAPTVGGGLFADLLENISLSQMMTSQVTQEEVGGGEVGSGVEDGKPGAELPAATAALDSSLKAGGGRGPKNEERNCVNSRVCLSPPPPPWQAQGKQSPTIEASGRGKAVVQITESVATSTLSFGGMHPDAARTPGYCINGATIMCSGGGGGGGRMPGSAEAATAEKSSTSARESNIQGEEGPSQRGLWSREGVRLAGSLPPDSDGAFIDSAPISYPCSNSHVDVHTNFVEKLLSPSGEANSSRACAVVAHGYNCHHPSPLENPNGTSSTRRKSVTKPGDKSIPAATSMEEAGMGTSGAVPVDNDVAGGQVALATPDGHSLEQETKSPSLQRSSLAALETPDEVEVDSAMVAPMKPTLGGPADGIKAITELASCGGAEEAGGVETMAAAPRERGGREGSSESGASSSLNLRLSLTPQANRNSSHPSSTKTDTPEPRARDSNESSCLSSLCLALSPWQSSSDGKHSPRVATETRLPGCTTPPPLPLLGDAVWADRDGAERLGGTHNSAEKYRNNSNSLESNSSWSLRPFYSAEVLSPSAPRTPSYSSPPTPTSFPSAVFRPEGPGQKMGGVVDSPLSTCDGAAVIVAPAVVVATAKSRSPAFFLSEGASSTSDNEGKMSRLVSFSEGGRGPGSQTEHSSSVFGVPGLRATPTISTEEVKEPPRTPTKKAEGGRKGGNEHASGGGGDATLELKGYEAEDVSHGVELNVAGGEVSQAPGHSLHLLNKKYRMLTPEVQSNNQNKKNEAIDRQLLCGADSLVSGGKCAERESTSGVGTSINSSLVTPSRDPGNGCVIENVSHPSQLPGALRSSNASGARSESGASNGRFVANKAPVPVTSFGSILQIEKGAACPPQPTAKSVSSQIPSALKSFKEEALRCKTIKTAEAAGLDRTQDDNENSRGARLGSSVEFFFFTEGAAKKEQTNWAAGVCGREKHLAYPGGGFLRSRASDAVVETGQPTHVARQEKASAPGEGRPRLCKTGQEERRPVDTLGEGSKTVPVGTPMEENEGHDQNVPSKQTSAQVVFTLGADPTAQAAATKHQEKYGEKYAGKGRPFAKLSPMQSPSEAAAAIVVGNRPQLVSSPEATPAAGKDLGDSDGYLKVEAKQVEKSRGSTTIIAENKLPPSMGIDKIPPRKVAPTGKGDTRIDLGTDNAAPMVRAVVPSLPSAGGWFSSRRLEELRNSPLTPTVGDSSQTTLESGCTPTLSPDLVAVRVRGKERIVGAPVLLTVTTTAISGGSQHGSRDPSAPLSSASVGRQACSSGGGRCHGGTDGVRVGTPGKVASSPTAPLISGVLSGLRPSSAGQGGERAGRDYTGRSGKVKRGKSKKRAINKDSTGLKATAELKPQRLDRGFAACDEGETGEPSSLIQPARDAFDDIEDTPPRAAPKKRLKARNLAAGDTTPAPIPAVTEGIATVGRGGGGKEEIEEEPDDCNDESATLTEAVIFEEQLPVAPAQTQALAASLAQAPNGSERIAGLKEVETGAPGTDKTETLAAEIKGEDGPSEARVTHGIVCSSPRASSARRRLAHSVVSPLMGAGDAKKIKNMEKDRGAKEEKEDKKGKITGEEINLSDSRGLEKSKPLDARAGVDGCIYSTLALPSRDECVPPRLRSENGSSGTGRETVAVATETGASGSETKTEDGSGAPSNRDTEVSSEAEEKKFTRKKRAAELTRWNARRQKKMHNLVAKLDQAKRKGFKTEIQEVVTELMALRSQTFQYGPTCDLSSRGTASCGSSSSSDTSAIGRGGAVANQRDASECSVAPTSSPFLAAASTARQPPSAPTKKSDSAPPIQKNDAVASFPRETKSAVPSETSAEDTRPSSSHRPIRRKLPDKNGNPPPLPATQKLSAAKKEASSAEDRRSSSASAKRKGCKLTLNSRPPQPTRSLPAPAMVDRESDYFLLNSPVRCAVESRDSPANVARADVTIGVGRKNRECHHPVSLCLPPPTADQMNDPVFRARMKARAKAAKLARDLTDGKEAGRGTSAAVKVARSTINRANVLQTGKVERQPSRVNEVRKGQLGKGEVRGLGGWMSSLRQDWGLDDVLPASGGIFPPSSSRHLRRHRSISALPSLAPSSCKSDARHPRDASANLFDVATPVELVTFPLKNARLLAGEEVGSKVMATTAAKNVKKRGPPSGVNSGSRDLIGAGGGETRKSGVDPPSSTKKRRRRKNSAEGEHGTSWSRSRSSQEKGEAGVVTDRVPIGGSDKIGVNTNQKRRCGVGPRSAKKIRVLKDEHVEENGAPRCLRSQSGRISHLANEEPQSTPAEVPNSVSLSLGLSRLARTALLPHSRPTKNMVGDFPGDKTSKDSDRDHHRSIDAPMERRHISAAAEKESTTSSPPQARLQYRGGARGQEMMRRASAAVTPIEAPPCQDAIDVSSAIFVGLSFVLIGLPESTGRKLEETIATGGGSLLDGIPRLPQDDPALWAAGAAAAPRSRKKMKAADEAVKVVIIVSLPTASRRPEYVLAISTGTPLLHLLWVSDSAAQGRALPAAPYLLPGSRESSRRRQATAAAIAGARYVTGGGVGGKQGASAVVAAAIARAAVAKVATKPGTPLTGMTMGIAHPSPEMCELWTRVLTAAGAQAVRAISGPLLEEENEDSKATTTTMAVVNTAASTNDRQTRINNVMHLQVKKRGRSNGTDLAGYSNMAGTENEPGRVSLLRKELVGLDCVVCDYPGAWNISNASPTRMELATPGEARSTGKRAGFSSPLALKRTERGQFPREGEEFSPLTREPEAPSNARTPNYGAKNGRIPSPYVDGKAQVEAEGGMLLLRRVMNAARRESIPLVSLSWAVDCVVCGTRVKQESRPEYLSQFRDEAVGTGGTSVTPNNKRAALTRTPFRPRAFVSRSGCRYEVEDHVRFRTVEGGSATEFRRSNSGSYAGGKGSDSTAVGRVVYLEREGNGTVYATLEPLQKVKQSTSTAVAKTKSPLQMGLGGLIANPSTDSSVSRGRARRAQELKNVANSSSCRQKVQASHLLGRVFVLKAQDFEARRGYCGRDPDVYVHRRGSPRQAL